MEALSTLPARFVIETCPRTVALWDTAAGVGVGAFVGVAAGVGVTAWVGVITIAGFCIGITGWGEVTTGVGLGVTVGVGLGATVGVGLGAAVGVGLGATVDIGLGATVGFGLGATVGFGLGATVGFGLGATVGVGLGATVGVGFGVTVGVGATKPVWIPTRLMSAPMSIPLRPAPLQGEPVCKAKSAILFIVPEVFANIGSDARLPSPGLPPLVKTPDSFHAARLL